MPTLSIAVEDSELAACEQIAGSNPITVKPAKIASEAFKAGLPIVQQKMKDWTDYQATLTAKRAKNTVDRLGDK